MKQQIKAKNRKKLEEKMSKFFVENLTGLSTELKEILIDDMVTALENRLKVLNVAQGKSIVCHL